MFIKYHQKVHILLVIKRTYDIHIYTICNNKFVIHIFGKDLNCFE